MIPPFAGEIPFTGKKRSGLLGKISKKFHHIEETPPVKVVEEGKRDIINEAFRVVRGNIDFMIGRNSSDKVIMITSFNPGSGKSFITYNLALSYCIKGKKILIIDCDLRHGSTSKIVGNPSKGLSTYLSGNESDWKKLLLRSKENINLDIMPVGKIPPNPAELLEEDKFNIMIGEARKEYDLIFLDCPPVNIVVDTQIVAQIADRTIFIIRSGLLERSAIKELNDFYKEKRFKNIGVILNGTDEVNSRYYTYGNYQNLN